jgi:lantibiotic leader peptide-processing serine protease
MRKLRWSALAAMLLLGGLVFVGSSPAKSNAGAAPGRYLVIAKSAADYAAMRDQVQATGANEVLAMPAINTVVVVADLGAVSTLSTNSHVKIVAPDRVEHLIRPGMQPEFFGPQGRTRYKISAVGAAVKVTPDPAYFLDGLMWNLKRIDAKDAWQKSTGSPDVLVGVADTGLDYTHLELSSQVVDVQDFTTTEAPVICSPSDEELAPQLGAPADDLDFNGHGSWIGGNIAGALNGTGINGIAPSIGLVALKISGWCGSAYDSTILNAFIWAADHGLDVVSISFGGYLDRSDPVQDAIYDLYVSTVRYVKRLGTVIAASAGNEHARIGAGGQVISHGILDVPPGGTDFFGFWQLPAGIPGVVDVGATGNVVKGSKGTCPADSLAAGSHQWCKPKSDAHQSFGVGEKDQLTYYSNYGPRIDVAAPGGARKFNLPNGDRGGTEGWPWTGVDSLFGGTSVSDGHSAWQAFSITSNWALGIPCFTFTGFPEFPEDQCYAIIQGTSMAAPHASAVLALIASTHPNLRHDPAGLIAQLKSSAKQVTGNTTPPVSATDTSNTDLTGLPCPGGFCHLGGPAISDADAYGAGLVNAGNAVK